MLDTSRAFTIETGEAQMRIRAGGARRRVALREFLAT
jgi:hypothetical protein